MPGPLPAENPRRRNAATIPTTQLPIDGRTAPAPGLPSWVELGDAGRAWWAWAWATPQAAAWTDGDASFVANRAALEDDMAALSKLSSPDALDMLDTEDFQPFRQLIKRLAAVATGRLGVIREMREMDTRLGLTPKGMADLRWKIVASDADAPAAPDEVGQRRDRRSRLTA